MNSEAATYIADALTDTYGSPEVVSAHNGLRRKEAADRGQSEPTDEELLLQVGAGSREALGFLFRRHARAVNHIAFRILRDECEADDLRQDVFVYLSERAQLFDAEKGSGSSWIMQVTYHRAIDRRRHLVSRQHYSAEEFDEQRLPNTKAEPLEDAIAGREILDRMREQLTTNQQQTLELHFFEGYSLREIAEKKGQTVGNVRHHFYRALERIRSHVFPPKA